MSSGLEEVLKQYAIFTKPIIYISVNQCMLREIISQIPVTSEKSCSIIKQEIFYNSFNNIFKGFKRITFDFVLFTNTFRQIFCFDKEHILFYLLQNNE